MLAALRTAARPIIVPTFSGKRGHPVLFSTGYRDTQRAILVMQNGAWKISSMPQYNFFDYNWYQETPK